MFLLKMEENAYFSYFKFNQLFISIFSDVLKKNVNWAANFSGLIFPKKWTDLSQNVILLGSCKWGLKEENWDRKCRGLQSLAKKIISYLNQYTEWSK